MIESYPASSEQHLGSPENLALDEVMRGEAKVFAVEMSYSGIEPTAFFDERTQQESRYWIIRRGLHYDGETRLITSRSVGSRARHNLRQVIVIHEDGRLDIATQQDVHTAEPHRQYAPHNVENLRKALLLDHVATPDKAAAALEAFRSDLDQIRAKWQVA
jgi:hypothetical protein